MATTMKTIKFGENGETYAVNAWAVERSGELSEAANVIDFGGAFDKGLTEINAVVRGVEGTSGNYFYIGINGTESGFITGGIIYGEGITIKLKKLGNLWDVNIYSTGSVGNSVPYAKALLDSVDAITNLSIRAYDNTTFAAGTKYAMEGR